jgi:integrase
VPARKTTDGRTPDGKWIDRWREGDTRRQRTFDRKGDRDAFRDRRRRTQQLGRALSDELLLEKDLTLAAWVEQWWARHAVPNLESQTRASYKQQWGKWIKPRLGSYELRALTPRVINEQLVAKMRKAGAGEPTVRLCLALLQSMLRLAAIEERITANPIDLIAKPSALPDGQLDPVAPAVVETLRRAATSRRGALGTQDAFIIAVLAYAGLRPQELLALQWDDVLGENAKLFVARKNVDGELLPYLKSGRKRRNRRHRRVDLFEPLAADFREHRMSSGRRAGLVIARPDGGPWRKHDWDNWREASGSRSPSMSGSAGTWSAEAGPSSTRARTPTTCAPRSCRCWCGRAAPCSRSQRRPATASTYASCTTHASSRATTRPGAPVLNRPSRPLVDPKDARWTSSGARLTRATRQPRTKRLHTTAKPTGGLEPPTPSLRVMCSTS